MASTTLNLSPHPSVSGVFDLNVVQEDNYWRERNKNDNANGGFTLRRDLAWDDVRALFN